MDIKAAFDTIKQDKMMDIVSQILDKVGYVSIDLAKECANK
jgi:hypothetical protein